VNNHRLGCGVLYNIGEQRQHNQATDVIFGNLYIEKHKKIPIITSVA